MKGTIDEDKWFAPAWMLAENQFVITWNKREERLETGKFEYIPFKSPPSNKALARQPISVYHTEYGQGIAHAFKLDSNDFIDVVNPTLIGGSNGAEYQI